MPANPNWPDDKPLIEVTDLVTHYGESKILDGVSMKVYKGKIVIILGGSGSGKTTLLKHMCGLLTATSGSITFYGQEITELEEDRLAAVQQGFGIAFQSGGLFNSMTVGENVALPIREYCGIRDEALIDALVRMKLNMVGLGDAQHKMPSELSGGMKKRAGLARALALDPPIVFFDEPSAGLDPIMASGLDELILKLRDLLGVTFVVVTHELDSIRTIADEVVFLDLGKVIFNGTVKEAEERGGERVEQFFARKPDEVISQRTAV